MFDYLLLIIILIVIFETTAIMCVKKYHNENCIEFFFLAILLYAVVCYLLHYSLYYNNSVGINNVLWSGLSIFIVTLSGVLFFKEKLHLHDIIAGSLITAGIVIFKITE